MAWSIGSNVTAGSVLTASRYNQDVIANLTELAPFMSAFTSWTPTLKQTTTPTQTNVRSRYLKVGKLLVATYAISLTGSATAGAAITLDFSSIGTAANADASFGAFRHFDTGVTNYVGISKGASTTTLEFFVDAYGSNHGQQPVNLSNGDTFFGWFVSELA